MVPLDVADVNGDSGFNIPLLWQILLCTQVGCVWVIFPIVIVYYESNENDGFVSLTLIELFVEEEDQAVPAGSDTFVSLPCACDGADLLLA